MECNTNFLQLRRGSERCSVKSVLQKGYGYMKDFCIDSHYDLMASDFIDLDELYGLVPLADGMDHLDPLFGSLDFSGLDLPF